MHWNKAISAREALHSLTAGSMPVRFAFVDISSGSAPFPFAEHLENVTDYIASEAKVAVMYAAYVLRDMARRFAKTNGITRDAELFSKFTASMNPLIRGGVSRIASAKNIMDVHRLPKYQGILSMSAGGDVDFTGSFGGSLEDMIVPSDNSAAGACVHGVGYSYLNGALAAGGFFNVGADNGVWLAGDFSRRTNYPYVRIDSVNDGPAAQTGTARHMARLVSLLATEKLLQTADCDEMLLRLQHAAVGVDQPWTERPGILRKGCITHNKLGYGPLKSGRLVWSEVSVLSDPVAAGKRYVVAWQNTQGASEKIGPEPVDFADIATVMRDTITEYERP